eukprot:COSAG06_NODE_14950_length_1112_cov_1.215202_1_plen_285_part_10
MYEKPYPRCQVVDIICCLCCVDTWRIALLWLSYSSLYPLLDLPIEIEWAPNGIFPLLSHSYDCLVTLDCQRIISLTLFGTMHFAADGVADSEVSEEYENPMADDASPTKKKKSNEKIKGKRTGEAETEFDDGSGNQVETPQGTTSSKDTKRRTAIRKSAEKHDKRAVNQAKVDGTEPPQPLDFDAEGNLIDKEATAAALAETERLRALFNEMDTDNIGSLNPDEVKVLLENVGFKLNKKKLAKAFEVMDADGSGEIDFGEFIAWHDSLSEGEREELRLMADQARQ